jgi:hypothetical protein
MSTAEIPTPMDCPACGPEHQVPDDAAWCDVCGDYHSPPVTTDDDE